MLRDRESFSSCMVEGAGVIGGDKDRPDELRDLGRQAVGHDNPGHGHDGPEQVADGFEDIGGEGWHLVHFLPPKYGAAMPALIRVSARLMYFPPILKRTSASMR